MNKVYFQLTYSYNVDRDVPYTENFSSLKGLVNFITTMNYKFTDFNVDVVEEITLSRKILSKNLTELNKLINA